MSSAGKVRRPEDASAVILPTRTAAGAVVLGRPATDEDLERIPPTWRAEIIEGTLYAFPRPNARHQEAGGSLFEELRPPFHRGRGGPGGWWILAEPGVRLPNAREFSPDIAGWRRERLATLPARGPIRIAPDWVCEVLSPSTRRYDSVTKWRFYAGIGVTYLWYVDPLACTLEALKLVDRRWVSLGRWEDAEKVRVEPFEVVELDLSRWWGATETTDERKDEGSPEPPSSASL